jgi:tetratricopeptide (TPR) repeat protein
VGACANLGLVYMRGRQWAQALTMLRRAETLAPQVAGIRLNVGLVYYRQNDYRNATSAFESVLRDQQDSAQARYLLGLSYFFTDHYAEAARTLELLWPQESSNLIYLYVIEIAAEKGGLPALRDRALDRFLQVGQDTPQFHLLVGKAYLTESREDKAISELEQAARADPRLPFVHFNLGLTYRRRHDFVHAKAEFLKDLEIEPDVAFNYDELGAVCPNLQQEDEAERYFREALRRDSHLASSYFGLAKIYEHKGRLPAALAALDSAGQVDPSSASIHYLRGQILLHMGRRREAQSEFDIAGTMQKQTRDEFEREVSGEQLPSPEITVEAQ